MPSVWTSEHQPTLAAFASGNAMAGMGNIDEGTPEWFKERKRRIVSHARALDCIASARRSITSLLVNWDNPDPEVRAALHSATVISYARPFSDNRDIRGRWSKYPERYLNHERFDQALHRHLLVLRSKLIAHHDSEYLSAKLLHTGSHCPSVQRCRSGSRSMCNRCIRSEIRRWPASTQLILMQLMSA